jgi:tetratricopeptide (TPR) repeat protein
LRGSRILIPVSFWPGCWMQAELRVPMGTTEAGLKTRRTARTRLVPRLAIARLAIAISIASCSTASCSIASWAQDHQTIRHRRVAETDPAAAKLAEAETDIDKQDYASAEPLLKEYLENDPESYSAWYDLGYVYHAMGKSEEAIAAYRKSVAAKPDLFESNLNLGLALAAAGQPEGEQFLRAATKLKPASGSVQSSKRAWMALGNLLATAKPDDAAVAFQQAAILDKKDPEPHLLAAFLLEKQQKAADAEKEYQQALTVAPESGDALAGLTNFYMRQKRFVDAETLLRKLVTLRPNDASAHLQLGRMLAISGKNDEAAVEMEAGLRLDPADSKAERDLADLYADSGKYAEAQKLYSALLAANPNDADLHFGVGRMLVKQRQFAQAEQELLRTVKLRPDMGPAYGELAVAADQNKDYALAIKAADMRAKYMPEIPIAYFIRASAYDHLQDVKTASKYYHLFLDVAGGKYPDQEWQAKHRLIAIEPKK